MSNVDRKLADGILGHLDTLLTEGWITVNGARVLIDDDTGEVTGGPKGLRDKVFKDAESKPLDQLQAEKDPHAGRVRVDKAPGDRLGGALYRHTLNVEKWTQRGDTAETIKAHAGAARAFRKEAEKSTDETTKKNMIRAANYHNAMVERLEAKAGGEQPKGPEPAKPEIVKQAEVRAKEETQTPQEKQAASQSPKEPESLAQQLARRKLERNLDFNRRYSSDGSEDAKDQSRLKLAKEASDRAQEAFERAHALASRDEEHANTVAAYVDTAERFKHASERAGRVGGTSAEEARQTKESADNNAADALRRADAIARRQTANARTDEEHGQAYLSYKSLAKHHEVVGDPELARQYADLAHRHDQASIDLARQTDGQKTSTLSTAEINSRASDALYKAQMRREGRLLEPGKQPSGETGTHPMSPEEKRAADRAWLDASYKRGDLSKEYYDRVVKQADQEVARSAQAPTATVGSEERKLELIRQHGRQDGIRHWANERDAKTAQTSKSLSRHEAGAAEVVAKTDQEVKNAQDNALAAATSKLPPYKPRPEVSDVRRAKPGEFTREDIISKAKVKAAPEGSDKQPVTVDGKVVGHVEKYEDRVAIRSAGSRIASGHSTQTRYRMYDAEGKPIGGRYGESKRQYAIEALADHHVKSGGVSSGGSGYTHYPAKDPKNPYGGDS